MTERGPDETTDINFAISADELAMIQDTVARGAAVEAELADVRGALQVQKDYLRRKYALALGDEINVRTGAVSRRKAEAPTDGDVKA